MTEVFEGYERQYCDLSANVSWKCNSFATSNLEQKQRWLSELKVSLEEADDLIEKMDLEATSLQPGVKVNALDKLREYKADLVKVKKEFERLTSPTADQAAREELLELASADQREKMTMCLERINRSGERIRGGRRGILRGTEELGVPVLQDLQQLRETLLPSNRPHEEDMEDDYIDAIISTMRSQRIHRNICIVLSIIGVLVLVIVLIIVLIIYLTH